MESIWLQFIEGMKKTSELEYIAVFAGIASVYFSRKENILVYPVGLINTIIYIYLTIKGDLFGEATVNLYYTIMSVIGWVAWMRKDQRKQVLLHVTYSSASMWRNQLLFFSFSYVALYIALTLLKNVFAKDAIPWADAFASASAFTGMWLMTKKKVESWYWWIITNIASVPLFFVKGYVFTSVYYFILIVMAISGLFAWMKKAKNNNFG